MEFSCHCQSCQQELLATESHIGIEMECPACLKTFVVPPPPKIRRKYTLDAGSPSKKVNKDDHGQPVFKSKLTTENYASKAFDQLKGICHGILADGVITDDEARYFKAWVEKNSVIETTWPFSEISGRVRELFSGQKISEEERDDLKSIMEAITGGSYLPSLDEDTSTGLPLCFPQPTKVIFTNVEFCVTGRFAYGTRKKVEVAIEQRGGSFNPTPRFATKYLVIGHFASRDWKYTNYGTKIDRAVELRDQKSGISIISEETWKGSL